jgi:hypothetical protein
VIQHAHPKTLSNHFSLIAFLHSTHSWLKLWKKSPVGDGMLRFQKLRVACLFVHVSIPLITMTAAFTDIFFLLHFKAAHPHDLKNNPTRGRKRGEVVATWLIQKGGGCLQKQETKIATTIALLPTINFPIQRIEIVISTFNMFCSFVLI